jgi:Cys-tRNA(Pro)/Cys-tRNA(Cys) deacylase
MSTPTPVAQYLQQKNIPHREFVHPGPIRSLEQAAEERGQQPEQVVRSILFRLSEDEFVMVLMAGPRQVSWKALRRYLGQSRLTMAKDEEVLAATGFQPGAVSPFGLPHPLRIWWIPACRRRKKFRSAQACAARPSFCGPMTCCEPYQRRNWRFR